MHADLGGIADTSKTFCHKYADLPDIVDRTKTFY